MKSKVLAYGAMIAVVLIWGVSFIHSKIALQVVEPVMLATLRFTIATALIGAVMLIRKESFKIDIKDLPYFLVAGGVGISLYFYFENNGVLNTSASAASMIIASIPVFAMLVEAVLYKTKLTKKSFISLALSLTGVGMIVGLDSSLLEGNNLMGYLFMFGAVLAWIAYSISSKPLFEKYSQLKILFWQVVIGLALFLPFAFNTPLDLDRMTPEIWGHIVMLGVVASAIGFFVYLYALDALGLGLSSLYLNLIPVVTVIVGFFVLGERLGALQLVGGALIVVSVTIVSGDSQEEIPAEQVAMSHVNN